MSQTVDRALALLERMAVEPQSLGMLAEHLGVHKSTALRLAQSLERAGIARRGPDGLYTPGTRLLSIASRVLDDFDIRDIARPHLSKLNQETGHTLHLASLVDRDVIYIDKYESTSSIRMYSQIGKTALLHASGVGKAILAFQPEPILDDILSNIDFQRYTPQTLADRDSLLAELRAIEARGYAFDLGEFEEIILCIAAPIRSADGSVSSAVSVSAPKPLVSLDDLKALLPRLLGVTDAISRECGWIRP